jgi:hypothetical protein
VGVRQIAVYINPKKTNDNNKKQTNKKEQINKQTNKQTEKPNNLKIEQFQG